MSNYDYTPDAPDSLLSGKMADYLTTDEMRKIIHALITHGITAEMAASILDISKYTLYKHYKDVIDVARPAANAAVIQTLFKMATSGKHPAATFFYLKTICGFKETQNVNHTGGMAQVQCYIPHNGRDALQNGGQDAITND